MERPNQICHNKRANEAILSMLREGRLPHALLLEGPDGSGKTDCARAIAAAALCEADDRAARPCGVCRHCIKVDKDIHPDFVTIDGAGGSRSFHIDAIRALRGQASLAPNEGRCRVYLLTHCQNMTVQAQNALLKLLEEPPAQAVIILTCLNRHLMLPTIQSRVVSLGLEDTERLLDPSQEEGPEADARQLLEALGAGQEYRALALLAKLEQAKKGRDRYAQVLEMTGHLVRCRLTGGPDYGLSPLQAVQFVDIIEQAKKQTMQNVGLSLVSALLCARAAAVVSQK